jgi:eukaryotic translation initiation factor 2C
MLDELRDMLVEPFLVYEKKNKVLPQRIFVYRMESLRLQVLC